MNQRIKDEWVAMLRYGGLKQCQGSLTDSNKGSFCCLGVLCEMARAEGIVKLNENDSYYDEHNILDKKNGSLPEAVQIWAGLDKLNSPHNPTPGNYEKDDSLAELNDFGYTFKQIANRIEEEL